MSIIRNIRIALSADSKGFVRPVATVTSSLDRFNASVKKTQSGMSGINFGAAGAKIGLGFAAIGAGIRALKGVTGFFAQGVKDAADYGESMSKFGNIFKGEALKIESWANKIVESFSRQKTVLIDAASTFGLIGKGAGQTIKEAGNMSRVMVQLALDAESFHNVPLEVALERIQAGLRGESEPLSKFGILLNEDAVKAEAVAMGLIRAGKEMNNQAKVAARANLIVKGSADANNDLYETQDQVMGRWRKLTGDIANFRTAMGSLLLPAVEKAIEYLNRFTKSGQAAFAGQKTAFISWSEGLVKAVEVVGNAILNMGSYWKIGQLYVQEFVENSINQFSAFYTNLGLIADYMQNYWTKAFINAGAIVVSYFRNMTTNMMALWQGAMDFMAGKGFHVQMVDMFKDLKFFDPVTLPKLVQPAVVSLKKEMDAEWAKIAGRGKPLVDYGPMALPPALEKLGPLGGGEEKKKTKGKKEEGAAALELGSQEAASAVAKFMNQAPDDKPMKETAIATKETAIHTKSVAQAMQEIKNRAAAQAIGLGGFNMYPL